MTTLRSMMSSANPLGPSISSTLQQVEKKQKEDWDKLPDQVKIKILQEKKEREQQKQEEQQRWLENFDSNYKNKNFSKIAELFWTNVIEEYSLPEEALRKLLPLKKQLFEYLAKQPEALDLLLRIRDYKDDRDNPNDPLRIFWKQRDAVPCSLTSGVLRKVVEEIERRQTSSPSSNFFALFQRFKSSSSSPREDKKWGPLSLIDITPDTGQELGLLDSPRKK